MDRLKPRKPLNRDVFLLQHDVKSSLLLHCIGERARKVYNTFNLSNTGDSMKLQNIREQFEVYFNPRKKYGILYIAQVQSCTYCKDIGQSFDHYLTELRKLSCDCELEDLRESLLRDILLTVFDEEIFQELFLRESNHLHLNKMDDISRTVEIIRSQTHAIQIIAPLIQIVMLAKLVYNSQQKHF